MISMKVLQDYSKSFVALSGVKKSEEERERDHIAILYFLRECRRKIFEKDTDGTFKHIKQDMIDKIAISFTSPITNLPTNTRLTAILMTPCS